MPEGFGYLRSADYNYLNSPDDVYVSNRQIKAAGLQTGDNVVCSIRPPRKGDKYYPMVEVLKVNGRDPVLGTRPGPLQVLTPPSSPKKPSTSPARATTFPPASSTLFPPSERASAVA